MVYYACLPVAALGVIANLDRAAAGALRTLRPLLLLDDGAVAALHRELTVAPARPAAVIALLSFALTPLSYVADPVGAGVAGFSPLGLGFRWLWEGLITAIFLVLVYHTVRQLRLIGRIHDQVGSIDAFDQAPLYAMSGVTSGTAAGLILLLAPSAFLIPAGASESFLIISIGWYAMALVIALAAFGLPLRGMHDRLVRERERLQGEVGRRISTTLQGINAAVDAAEPELLEIRTKALTALLAERDVVNRVSTWPWSTGSLTRFVSAVLLPLGLWLATRLLERLL
jgi:hypothetical protein